MSSRLVTSYALPPQSKVACPPCSLRTRLGKGKVQRRTYLCTEEQNNQVILFTETTDGHGAVQTSTVTRRIDEPAIFMQTIKSTRSSEFQFDLLIVQSNGQTQCLHGGTLEEVWVSLASTIWREATIAPSSTTIEYAQITNSLAIQQGTLKDRPELFSLYGQELSENISNPEVLLLISRSITDPDAPFRTLHFLSLPTQGATIPYSTKSTVNPIFTVKLPTQVNGSESSSASFNFDVGSGTLYQSANDALITLDVRPIVPKYSTSIAVSSMKSFLFLSSTSIMVSSGSTITVYNPKYGSVVGLQRVDYVEDRRSSSSLKRKRGSFEEEAHRSRTCDLIAYYPKPGLVVSVVGSNLVGIQTDFRQPKGPGAPGLLIDSIGRSTQNSTSKFEVGKIGLTSLANVLPGSFASNKRPWNVQIRESEKLHAQGDMQDLEVLLLRNLGGKSDAHRPELINGSVKHNGDSQTPVMPPTEQSSVDQRWIIYALGKIFEMVQPENGSVQLRVKWYPEMLFPWLVKSGSLTVANIESALGEQVRATAQQRIPAGDLVNAVVDLDPDLQLLYGVLLYNQLGAHELLRAIRELMQSLGLFAEDNGSRRALLMDGDTSHALVNGDVDVEVEELGEQAETDLEIAEYQLGPGSGVRGEALSIALSKLYTCSSSAIVHSLQKEFTSHEIVSLIYLLRIELVRGSWTSKYMDVNPAEPRGTDFEVSDNAIVLMSSLLNNCIDAIGAGGWLSGNANLINGDFFDSEDLITGLKLEVTAALDGIEEFVYLKGLTSEMIKFGNAVQKSTIERLPTHPNSKGKYHTPVAIPSFTQETSLLPMGLKAEQQISRLRVGAGGELHERSKRDISRLKSRAVGKYTLERIFV